MRYRSKYAYITITVCLAFARLVCAEELHVEIRVLDQDNQPVSVFDLFVSNDRDSASIEVDESGFARGSLEIGPDGGELYVSFGTSSKRILEKHAAIPRVIERTRFEQLNQYRIKPGQAIFSTTLRGSPSCRVTGMVVPTDGVKHPIQVACPQSFMHILADSHEHHRTFELSGVPENEPVYLWLTRTDSHYLLIHAIQAEIGADVHRAGKIPFREPACDATLEIDAAEPGKALTVGFIRSDGCAAYGFVLQDNGKAYSAIARDGTPDTQLEIPSGEYFLVCGSVSMRPEYHVLLDALRLKQEQRVIDAGFEKVVIRAGEHHRFRIDTEDERAKADRFVRSVRDGAG